MFVLAVPILVAEHLRGKMRLVSTDTKGDTNVSKLRTDVVVEGPKLCAVVSRVLSEFRSLRADVRCGLNAFLLEIHIPATHLFPTLKAGQLDLSGRKLAACGLICSFLLVFPPLIRRLVFQLGSSPGENATRTFVGD